MSDKILGHEYHIIKTHDPHPPRTFQNVQVLNKDGEKKTVKKDRKSFYIKPYPRIVIDALKHPKSDLPIRFKSIQRAENYIRNFRLEKKEAA